MEATILFANGCYSQSVSVIELPQFVFIAFSKMLERERTKTKKIKNLMVEIPSLIFNFFSFFFVTFKTISKSLSSIENRNGTIKISKIPIFLAVCLI